MASKQGSSTAKAAAADCDPVYEWVDGDGSYLLRLNLPGFKKEDFRVHVDPAGRLTIIGHRLADGGTGSVRLHKVFQLPSTSDLDGITGRYDGSALALTVPKLLTSSAVPVPPPEAPKKEQDKEASAGVADKPTDKKSRVSREAEWLIEAARARQGRKKEEAAKEQTAATSKKSPDTKVVERKEEPKAEATARPAEKLLTKREDGHDEKARDAELKAKLEREAEQRIEGARARLHAAERETEREKTDCSWNSWKERATEEGLKLAEVIGNNREVIATAVAAFTLGVFVSHRLFSRS